MVNVSDKVTTELISTKHSNRTEIVHQKHTAAQRRG